MVILNDTSKVTWKPMQSGYAGPLVMQVVTCFLMLLFAFSTMAQDISSLSQSSINSPKPNNCTHAPGSHMCDADYDQWLKEHTFRPWYKDPGFLVGEAVIGAAVSADMKTSSIGRDNHYVEQNNFLLPAVPSNRDYVLVGIAAFATYSALNWVNFHFVGQKNPSRFWHTLSYITVPAGIAVVHGHAAYHNMECCSSPWQSPLGGVPHY